MRKSKFTEEQQVLALRQAEYISREMKAHKI